MTRKIDVDLTGVPQTLLLPLLGRAKFSALPYSPLHDERAMQLVNELNYDFDQLTNRVGNVTFFWMARAYHFDQAVKAFLKQHPDGVIVNLGAGLETAFSRVDNGRCTWVDLDLPEVIALREKLLPPQNRQYYIAKSALDFSWMQEVKQYGNHFFIFAGGLFMYFTEEQMKLFLTEMTVQFPESELIFDTISEKGLYYANKMFDGSDMKGVKLTWGIDDCNKLTTWSPHITILSSFSFFTDIKSKYKFPFSQRCKMYLYDWFDKSRIVHLKFVS